MAMGTGVAMGKARDMAVERRWRRVIVQQRRSGLSVREFCRQGRFTETSFYHWRRELQRRREESQRHSAKPSPRRHARRTIPSSTTPAFVAVRLAEHDGGSGGPGPVGGSGGRMEIVLAGGRRICVSGPVDRAALAEVVSVLEGLAVVAAGNQEEASKSAAGGREVSPC